MHHGMTPFGVYRYPFYLYYTTDGSDPRIS